jgi:hypothetical protein
MWQSMIHRQQTVFIDLQEKKASILSPLPRFGGEGDSVPLSPKVGRGESRALLS